MILIGRGLDLKEGKSRKPEEIVGEEFQVNSLCGFQGVEKDSNNPDNGWITM